MQQITPHLWFDTAAQEAVQFYTTIFPQSKITQRARIHDTPSGDCDILSFEIAKQPFMAINAGPLFSFNQSISFIVNFDPTQTPDALNQLNQLWAHLSEGGTPLMPLDKYFFSERYGWIKDKFGVSWQLILSNPSGDPRPFLMPSLLFTGSVYGKAQAAQSFYASIFPNSMLGRSVQYGNEFPPNKADALMFSDFALSGQWFAAMDGILEPACPFNEAISLIIPCESQSEIDYFWKKLSADPAAEQCGWLKDAFGVSWQVWPTRLGQMLSTGTKEQVNRVTKAFLKMKKYDIEKLENVFLEK